MDTNQNQVTGLVSVLATVAAITAGMFLVGRYSVDDDKLTQVLLTKTIADVPPANVHAIYKPLATEPLDQWVGQYIDNWNGKDITLFFNTNGIFDHFETAKTAAA